MFASDFLISLGAGMTVKFFPLYFKSNVGLSPMQTQLIYIVVPLVMAVFASAAQRASVVLGRAQVMVLFRLVGVACLGAMVLLAEVAQCERWEVMVPIYLVRTALMNSVTPVEESLLMDSVPKNTRARWKSLESVMQFGWCGSAVLGGFIADKYKNTDRSGYTETFAFTCALQLVGTLVGALLLPLVPLEKPRSRGDADPLREPLLPEGGESPRTAPP
jgi:MFS family permease